LSLEPVRAGEPHTRAKSSLRLRHPPGRVTERIQADQYFTVKPILKYRPMMPA
jgi:hypothetical protein